MKRLLIILSFIIFFQMILVTPALSNENNDKFIVIIVDHLTLVDLEEKELRNFREMINRGSMALMNTNTAGFRVPSNTYATIANGVRSLGGDYGGLALNSEEDYQFRFFQEEMKAYDFLRGISGTNPEGQILHVGVNNIASINDKLLNGQNTGVLGTTLADEGIKIGLYGNSDSFSKTRLASLLAIDYRGQVLKGKINQSILIEDKTFPFGFRTDFDNLKREVLGDLQDLDYIVIETGDLSRLENYKEFLSEERYAILRVLTLRRIDAFIGDLVGEVDFDKSRLLILSPTPSIASAMDNNTLTPVILRGQGIEEGFLTSNSTRRIGVVANTDLAPTILNFWSIEQPSGFVGRPLSSVEGKGSLEQLKQLNSRLVTVYNQRPIIVKTFLVLQMVYILLALYALFFIKSKKLLQGLSGLVIFLLLIPVGLLFYRLYMQESLILTGGILLIFLVLTSFTLAKAKISFQLKLGLISILSSMLVIADAFTGSSFIMASPLGYDPIAGARYYGIGNEYAGVLLGSTIISFAIFFQNFSRYKKTLFYIAFIYFGVVVYTLYSPSLGANTGGLIAATLSLGFFMLRLVGGKVSKSKILFLGVLVLLILLAGASLDYYLNQGSGSHIGRTFGLLLRGDWGEMENIIVRKLSMNFKLIYYSFWTKVLALSLVALMILRNKEKKYFKELGATPSYLKKGFEAILVGSLIGFLFNDSGVVMASMASIYLIFPLFSLVLKP